MSYAIFTKNNKSHIGVVYNMTYAGVMGAIILYMTSDYFIGVYCILFKTKKFQMRLEINCLNWIDCYMID